MTTQGTIFVEAFGRFLTGGYDEEEDLYSVFRARSVLMGWYTTPRSLATRPPGLWQMQEADLAVGDSPRVGGAQVGLEAGVSIVIALPALMVCFDDSLRRFGAYESLGYQVTAGGLTPRRESYLGHLVEVLNYFEVSPKSRMATLAMYGMGKGIGSQIASELERRNIGVFRFKEGVPVRGWDVPPEMSPRTGGEPDASLDVTLPNGPGAAAWAMASALDSARTLRAGATSIRVSLAYK